MRIVKFNRTGHKRLWLWLAGEFAKHRTASTDDWPGWKHNGGASTAKNNCFACSYNNSLHGFICSKCPLLHGCFPVSKQLAIARDKNDFRSMERLARKMANLHIKPSVLCR